jgi:NADH-quinone oxidoreductase subunit A
LFVIFDIETVLIFPWTLVYRPALESGVALSTMLLPMLAFIGILVVGLVWAWRNGAVQWAKSPFASKRKTERDA